ncbi:hypothetical protein L873DRAFT_1806641 [Choiromyces venosus 120613-1]|uniref:Uncharacterized protein n=1 Tax=Choiromyces venosus 120613-1 TaxID=1336337 RepID=A0A3N4JMH5_9PEZI|nr:hypothetical protein L873DRAFT_1806641 [Choiromyces venosus 120613-1]
MKGNKSDAAGTTAMAGASTVPAFDRRKTPQRRDLKQPSIALVERSTSYRSLALIIISGGLLYGMGLLCAYHGLWAPSLLLTIATLDRTIPHRYRVL